MSRKLSFSKAIFLIGFFSAVCVVATAQQAESEQGNVCSDAKTGRRNWQNA